MPAAAHQSAAPSVIGEFLHWLHLLDCAMLHWSPQAAEAAHDTRTLSPDLPLLTVHQQH
jgi:hypothetical protein